MSVRSFTFRPYEGEWTNPNARFWVMTRYALQDVLRSKFHLALIGLGLLPNLVSAALIYLKYNRAFKAFSQMLESSFLPIDASFFSQILEIQMTFGLMACVLIGPSLISSDLTFRALPLYLSRPFSKWEYIAGKMMVLAGVQCALITVPVFGLFLFKSSMAGYPWFRENAGIGIGILVSSLAWILYSSLMSLSFSAWVKWKPIAGILIFSFISISAGVGKIAVEITGSPWFELCSPRALFSEIRSAAFGLSDATLKAPYIAFVILTLHMAAWLWIIFKKIRAYEVVR